jgi:hypothetical protein
MEGNPFVAEDGVFNSKGLSVAADQIDQQLSGEEVAERVVQESALFVSARVLDIGAAIVHALERIEKKLDVLVGDDDVTAPDDVEILGASQVNAVEDPETGRRVLRRFDIED